MADNTSIFFRGGSVVTDGMPANQCLLKAGRQSIYAVCQPTKFWLKIRQADFNTVPFVGADVGLVPQYNSAAQRALDPAPFLSGDRTGITFEGPFLVYSVSKMAIGGVDMRGTYNNGRLEFWFDLVSNRTIFLPWAGDLEIVSQYPGTWEFETFFLPDYGVRPDPSSSRPRMSQAPNSMPTPLDSDMTVTLRIASNGGANGQRTFEGVPPGVHSLTVNTESMALGIFPTVSIFQETSPIRGVAGFGGIPISTNIPLKQYAGVSAAFMNRVGWHNGVGLQVDTGAVGDGMVQMHLGFT